MYIDPNTGGAIFQALAVFFTVISGVVLLFSGKIRMWWARVRRNRAEKSRTSGEAESASRPDDPNP
jgi:hypothetical protein